MFHRPISKPLSDFFIEKFSNKTENPYKKFKPKEIKL